MITNNIKLKDINTARIDALFNELFRHGRKREMFKLRNPDFIPEGTRRPVSRKSKVNLNTVKTCIDGVPVGRDVAERLADTLCKKLGEAFIKIDSEAPGLKAGSIKRIRSALSPIFSTALKKELLLKK